MLKAHQLKTMLTLQHGINAKINPEWVTAGSPFLRAAMIEGCEYEDHHGFKWWKHQVKDIPQMQMELVDIWHFALSAIIVEFNGDIDAAAQTLAEKLSSDSTIVVFDGKEYDFSTLSLLDQMDLMIGLSAARRFDVPLFMSIVEGSEMATDELYRQYVGKNVLNFFRQDNGYKEGTYIKEWSGREDNEYLVDVLNSLDVNSATFSDEVMQGLVSNYAEFAKA